MIGDRYEVLRYPGGVTVAHAVTREAAFAALDLLSTSEADGNTLSVVTVLAWPPDWRQQWDERERGSRE